MTTSLPARLATRFRKFEFGRTVSRIEDTPPLARGKTPFTALSMVHRRDVLPYLLAIKSFATRTSPERVVVVADPSLDEGCISLIRKHVPFIEIRHAKDHQHPALPTGGTWERLQAIVSLVPESFVVQLDADTLTFGPVSDVLDCIAANRSFVIATEDDARITPIEPGASDAATPTPEGTHVQSAAEANLHVLARRIPISYIRGCSGFSGFARASTSFDRLRDISEGLAGLLGATWQRWGSEQVASNLMVSSTPNAIALPHPKYCSPDMLCARTEFLHFIGYLRFTTDLYRSLAAGQINLLNLARARE